MKKMYVLLGLAVVLMASCNSKKSDKETFVLEEDVAVVDTHNAQNALDVDGIYEGNLPPASGTEMKTVITLSGDTYKKSIIYDKEPNKTFETSGKFTWDQNGSIITLEGEEAPNKYFVAENKLIHLDIDGNMITGDLADKYILKKKL